MIMNSCYEITRLDQPAVALAEGSFTTHIEVTNTWESSIIGLPNLGILLPEGWIANDSVPLLGADSTFLAYDSVFSDSADVLFPSPPGYYWWVGVGTDTIALDTSASVIISPTIFTDAQIDHFELVYRVGHHGFIGWAGNGFLYSADTTIIFVSPDMTPLVGDVHVNPEGRVGGAGTSLDPILSIREALARMEIDSLNPGVIHLGSGTYSMTTTGDQFPIQLPSYTTLQGESAGHVLLAADDGSTTLSINGKEDIRLSNINISGGQGEEGGGIYCENSDLTLENVGLSGNHGARGGGIYCVNSVLEITNTLISHNTSESGGGIYSRNSVLNMTGSRITQNATTSGVVRRGGGLYLETSTVNMEDLTIHDNHTYFGGGFCSIGSQVSLEAVSIHDNVAQAAGGGIYSLANSSITFGSDNRSSIYFNQTPHSGLASDIFTDAPMAVMVDTFTVVSPTEFEVSPLELFSFDILVGLFERTPGDLYVSPHGSDLNNGQTPEAPLRSIRLAHNRIIPDSVNSSTIYLADGLYSPSLSGEVFPVLMRDHVNVVGESKTGVILDAEGTANVITFNQVGTGSLKNVTITGGSQRGIKCDSSNPTLENLIVTDNDGEGIHVLNGSEPDISYVIVLGNDQEGIYCVNSNPRIFNTTIAGNNRTGVSISGDSSPRILNSIIWGNTLESIRCYGANSAPDVLVAHSAVQGGLLEGVENGGYYTIDWATGNMNIDPLFVDIENNDLSLQEVSPCIDAGASDFIWGAETLLHIPDSLYLGDAPDMGALESAYTVTIQELSQIPEVYALDQNYPNPFNPSTTINYELPQQSDVEIIIYDILGQEVTTLVSEKQGTGYQSVQWDGRNGEGIQVATGAYIYKLDAGAFTKTRKMLLLK